MKKLLIWLFCVVMLLSATACGGEEKTEVEAPAPSSSSTPAEDTAPSGESTTTPTSQGDKTSSTKNTTTTAPTNNEVDWDAFGGDDPTTTTSKNGGSTGTTKPTGGSKTSTTKPTTTTTKPTTTTTLKPTTIDKVSLPAEGTDLDPNKPGRIKLSKISLKAGVVTFTIRNCTDKMNQKWITQETDYVTYACYDKNGKELKGKSEIFGYLYVGSLEVGKEVELKVTLPKGTTRVEITGSKFVYWTPWS